MTCTWMICTYLASRGQRKLAPASPLTRQQPHRCIESVTGHPPPCQCSAPSVTAVVRTLGRSPFFMLSLITGWRCTRAGPLSQNRKSSLTPREERGLRRFGSNSTIVRPKRFRDLRVRSNCMYLHDQMFYHGFGCGVVRETCSNLLR